jgi:mannose-6-phosphate isomerase
MTRNVGKPWGGEEIFAETERYVGKILTVLQGHSLSLQYHVHKDETMRVLDGVCELHIAPAPDRLDELKVLTLRAGDACQIRPGTVHRLVALSDVRLVEVSTPELLDVVRLEDCYGRAGTSAP